MNEIESLTIARGTLVGAIERYTPTHSNVRLVALQVLARALIEFEAAVREDAEAQAKDAAGAAVVEAQKRAEEQRLEIPLMSPPNVDTEITGNDANGSPVPVPVGTDDEVAISRDALARSLDGKTYVTDSPDLPVPRAAPRGRARK